MKPRRYLVMGAGEVGFHLAQSLSRDGHQVTVIELDPVKTERVADLLDANLINGNGANRSVLEAAGAEELAAQFPSFESLYGDCTDETLLRAERMGRAQTFVALTW